MPSKKERAALFKRMDNNGNGGLSLAEIDKAVLELWPEWDHKPALMRAYKTADVSGDGFIERREFRLLLKYIVYFNELWDKFEEIDSDGDRRLSEDEFAHGSRVVGLSLSAEEAAAEFANVDGDGGGFVLFDEFCAWAARTHLLGDEEEQAEAGRVGRKDQEHVKNKKKGRRRGARQGSGLYRSAVEQEARLEQLRQTAEEARRVCLSHPASICVL